MVRVFAGGLFAAVLGAGALGACSSSDSTFGAVGAGGGAGTPSGSGGTGGSTASLGMGGGGPTCVGEEVPCADTCCESGMVCFEGACSTDCGGKAPCGDAKTCCSSTEVCYLGGCVVPDGSCDGFGCATKVAKSSCKEGYTCDPDQKLCVPSLADPTCQYIPPPNQFSPRPQFTWGARAKIACNVDADCQTAELCTGGTCTPTWPHITPVDAPTHIHVSSIPLVVDLDGDCTPDIVFNSYKSGTIGGSGVLRALDGATGNPKWSVTDPAYATNSTSNPAVGDIDGDGLPEVVSQAGNRLVAIDSDGTPLWISDSFSFASNSGSVAIANMDGEGLPEIVFGSAVYSATGKLLWAGTDGTGHESQGPISCIADLDNDGRPELIGGNSAYKTTGTVAGNDFSGSLMWKTSVGDGRCGVADFNGDNLPEVILVRGGNVYGINGQSGLLISQFPIPNGSTNGGAPNIADFNGDGIPDIGTAGASRYVVVSFDGTKFTELWRAVTEDDSSRVTGSSVFDFDGDGRNEVIYNDEKFIRIYPGVEPDCELNPPGPLCDGVMDDSEVLFRDRNSSRTRTEYPVVADVDGDFKAELVFSTNSDIAWGLDAGVEVWGDALDNWVSTRPVWNQHSYHITNVNLDGTIPMNEPNSWSVPNGAPYNAYRRNVQGASDFCAPDLRPFELHEDLAACPLLVLSVDVVNVGCLGVGPGVYVSFYEQTVGYLGTVQTTGQIPAGGKERVTLSTDKSVSKPIVWAVVDDTGSGSGLINECDEDNDSPPLAICDTIN